MEPNEQIEKFKSFIENHYKSQLYEAIQQGKKSIIIDFTNLIHEEPELADLILENPEDTIRTFELAIEHFDLPEDIKSLRIRLRNLPESQKIKVSNIRSEHLGKFLYVEGIVRQASDVRPQVTSAKFECAGCGNTLSILQIDTKFKEPSRCTCGWRGKFRLINKDLIDVQHLKIEESPESLEGGEQPKRLSVFLKEDLVEPKMEKKTTPGSRINVYGLVKEVPIQLKTGAQSTRYDLILEANNVENVQEDFSEIILKKEDEDEILSFASDPRILEKFMKAISPSIYGHDDIKKALVLQMMGGVRKEKPDGTMSRGDVHVLLIGDPGCIAGNSQIALYNKGMNKIINLGKKHLEPIKEVVTKIRKNAKDKGYDFATVFQHYKNQPVLKLITETGKEVICTYNQPFLTKEGWERADKLILGEKIRVVPVIPNNVKKYIKTNFTKIKSKFNNLKEVKLPEEYTSELSALCGYILGDEHVHKDEYFITLYFNEEGQDLIKPIKELLNNLFNVEPIIYDKKPQIKTIDNGNGLLKQIFSKQKLTVMEINNRQVTNALSFLKEKKAPQEIFKSPKNVVASFLSWLYDANGCTFEKGRERTAIQLKSSRIELLKDVQLLLLYFGIHSRIENDNLYIKRLYDMELFEKNIGFNSQKKKQKLKEVLEVIKNKNEQQKIKPLQKYEKIKEIIPYGIQDVYDFEVPISHTFIANGIVCHNSGKSQLLQFISKAAPKARFASGKGASVDYNEPLLIKENGNIKLIKIGEFVDSNSNNKDEIFIDLKNKIETLSMNLETNKLEWKQIKAVYRHINKDKLFKFTLESGRQVTATKDHSIFILEDGRIITKDAGELKLKDCVIIPSKIPNVNSNNNLDPDLARLLGYYIAEGHLYCKNGSYKIEFTLNKLEEDLVNDIKLISKKHLGSEARNYKHGENGTRVTIYGKQAYLKFIELLGDVIGKHAKEKRIPSIIFNSSTQAIKEFIKGYISGDAGVTKSRYLMSDLLYLYLKEKIIASCNSRLEKGEVVIEGRKIQMKGYRYDLKSPHKNKIYKNRYLNPPNESLSNFINNYFFKRIISNDYKRANLNRIGNRKFFERLNFINDNILITGPELKKIFGESILEYFEDNKNIFTKIRNGRECLIALSDYGKQLVEEIINFRTLMNGDLGFTRIKKIEEVESSSPYVYDVSVPGNENFIGGFGGILLHNSGAGLCIAPDSLILTNPGGISKIKDIVEDNLKDYAKPYNEFVWNSLNPKSDKKIFTLDSNLKVKPKEINQLWRIDPPESMIKIKTRMGKEIIITENTKLYDIKLDWKESREFTKGDYLATTRNLNFKQNDKKILSINLLKSNPAVIGIKNKVKWIINEACKKNNITKRKLAKKLGFSEFSIYHNWVKNRSKGNIKLKNLIKLAEYACIPLEKVIDDNTSFSLYNELQIKLPKYINKELLYFAGLIAGDGDLSQNKSTVFIRFSNNNKKLMKKFILLSQNLFRITPQISNINSDKRLESRIFCSNLVFEILNSLGLPLSHKSNIIDMNDLLLEHPNDILKYYLRAYFDTGDGPNEKRKKYLEYIESSSTSKIFSEKLKLVLLRYGIIAKIIEKDPRPNDKIKSKYKNYCIIMRGKSNLVKFRDLIGFGHPENKVKLNRIIGRISKENTNIDIIPEAKTLIKQIENDLFVKILKRNDKSNLSKTFLLNLVPQLKKYNHENVKKLELLANSDIFWDEIVEIEKISNHGYEYVYDLTVEDSHNFIVNGILVHNTAAVVKDEFLKGWALEAGVLVLANKGTAVIDELDKIDKDDTAALHSAMEQQIIPISKANIQATLHSETTILAAANPKFGRFDPYTPIAAQIDLPSTLINRFDLIFPVRDIPNKEKDEKIALHVLDIAQRKETYETEVSIKFMRKYISYAKKIKPKMTKLAINEIKNFYVNLRNSGGGEDTIKPIPISARQLEGLIRLAEASARLRLDDKITKDDAIIAIQLVTDCLMKIGVDPETGKIDIDRISTGISASTRGKIMLIRDIINQLESKGEKQIPIEEIMAAAAAKGMEDSKVEEAIDQLKKSGDIFEPKRGFISKVN